MSRIRPCLLLLALLAPHAQATAVTPLVSWAGRSDDELAKSHPEPAFCRETPVTNEFAGIALTKNVLALRGVDDIGKASPCSVRWRLQQHYALVPLAATASGETATRWGYAGADGRHDRNLGEIGLISSVSHAFCGDCNRARLSTEGRLFLCLFASSGWDLRSLLRGDYSDAQIAQALAGVWRQRNDNYSERRSQQSTGEIANRQRIEMSYIGG